MSRRLSSRTRRGSLRTFSPQVYCGSCARNRSSSRGYMFSAGLLWGFLLRTTNCKSRETSSLVGLSLFLCAQQNCQSRDTSSPPVYNGFGSATDSQPGDAFAPQVHIVFLRGERSVVSVWNVFQCAVAREHTCHFFWRRRRRGSSKIINFNHRYSRSASNRNSHTALHFRPARTLNTRCNTYRKQPRLG